MDDAQGSLASLKDQIESSVASHNPSGPDIDSAVNGAVEERNVALRKRNEESTPADRSDRLRQSIRAAVAEAKRKAAQPQRPQTTGYEVPPGPPASWSAEAKARWSELPAETRMAALREQKLFGDAIAPIAQRAAEIESVLAPHRQIYQQHGISDAAAVKELFDWYGHLRGPQRAAAFAHLMAQTNTSLQDIASLYGYQQQQHGGEPPIDPQMQARAAQDIARISSKPHFETVRRTMAGLLMTRGEKYLRPDGQTNIEQLYVDAVRAEGLSDSAQSKRKAAVSPSSRSPVAVPVSNEKGKGVRGSIMAAIKESRENY